MTTNSNTPPSSSAKPPVTVELTLPRSWRELYAAGQLGYVLHLLSAGYTAGDIAALLCLRLTPRRYRHRIDPQSLGYAATTLSWLADWPSEPFRPDRIARRRALPANLQGTPFATYLVLSNLWTALLAQMDTEKATAEPDAPAEPQPALLALLAELYPGYRRRDYRPHHEVIALFWLQGLDALLSATFPHLFQPAEASEGDPDRPDPRERMESLLRALTGGDITKRAAVLQADTWAALAELDAKAREAAEYKT